MHCEAADFFLDIGGHQIARLVIAAIILTEFDAAGLEEMHRAAHVQRAHADMAVGARLTAALKGRVLISAGSKPYFAVKIDRTGGKDALDTLREALEVAGEDTQNE